MSTWQSMSDFIEYHNMFIADIEPTLQEIAHLHKEQKEFLRLAGLDEDVPINIPETSINSGEAKTAGISGPPQDPVARKFKRKQGRPKKEDEIDVNGKLIEILQEWRETKRSVLKLTRRWLAEKVGCSESSIQNSPIWDAIKKLRTEEKRIGFNASAEHCEKKFKDRNRRNDKIKPSK